MHKGITQSGVFVECCRHRTPIIALRQEGILQFFDNCGCLISDPYNPKEIINSFKDINYNFKKFSENSGNIFEKEFSTKNFLRFYEFLFR